MKALPEAHLVHHAFGRTRVRIPSRKGDLSYFEKLGRTIESSESVQVRLFHRPERCFR